MAQVPNIQYQRNVVQKGASYTVLVTDSGTIFEAITGAVTFTLPTAALATATPGLEFDFFNTVDANMAITAPSGLLMTDGNASATTATFSTTSHKIGGGAKVIWDGAKYMLLPYGTLSAVPSIT
jgi:hypothetical protein